VTFWCATVYYDAPKMSRRKDRAAAEQLSAFGDLEAEAPVEREPAPDTMRHIVSLRMPDALLERVEAAARQRGVSPSSLMRALIAAGLDRSYAVMTEQGDVAAELAELRSAVHRIAERLDVPFEAMPESATGTEKRRA
jgi:hypothetical protein